MIFNKSEIESMGFRDGDCIILHCQDGDVCGHIYAIGNYDISITDFELGILDVDYDDIASVAELDEESLAYYDEKRDTYRMDVEGVVRTTSAKYLLQAASKKKSAEKAKLYEGLQNKSDWKWLWLVSIAVVALFFYLHSRQVLVTESGEINDHAYVDLGLPSGKLWATSNLGACEPEKFGDYYAPGEVTPDTKQTDKTAQKLANDAKENSNPILNAENDAAAVNWGKEWRTPTTAELQELIDGCDWVWTRYKGTMGYEGTSKKNGNTIFLPAGGIKQDSYCYYLNESGDLMSSNFNPVWYLDFDCQRMDYKKNNCNINRFNIRPVAEKK